LNENISKVVYKTSLYKANEKLNSNITELQDKLVQFQESFEFELYFDKSKSIFKLVDKIDLDDQSVEYKIARGLSNDLFYRDLLKKEKINQTTSNDELFNVIKPIDEYKWIITNETKVIDGYTCYKATCQYNTYDENRKKPLSFNPIVWFAPSLPYSFGPSGLDGLPGLVLEGTFNGRLYFYATKISFNDKTLIKLDRPIHGKYVDETDFLKIDAENFRKINETR